MGQTSIHLDLLLVSRELPHHIHPRDSDLASTPDVRKRVGAHACAHVRTRAACTCVASPRARAHGSPARTWSHAKPCTHDCSDQTQLGSLRFVVAPLQRRRAAALQRWTVAWCPPHAAWRMRHGCLLRFRVADLRLGCRRVGRRSRRRRCRRRGRPSRRRPGHLHSPRRGIPRDVDSPAARYPARCCMVPCLASCATSGGLVDAGCARWPSATRCNTVYHADVHAGLIVAEAA